MKENEKRKHASLTIVGTKQALALETKRKATTGGGGGGGLLGLERGWAMTRQICQGKRTDGNWS